MSSASPATKKTHGKQLFRLVRKRKFLRARDLAEQGLSTIALTRLVPASKLERVARGLYGLAGAAMSEHRSLAEVALRVPRGVVCLPMGYVEFPREILRPPRSVAARQYSDIRRWTTQPKGGHFAALEQPEVLAHEIREFFRPLRATR